MKSNTPDIDWADTLEKFAAYKGTVASFCKKYNVSQHRLYYQRKKAGSVDTSFYPLTFKTTPDMPLDVEEVNVNVELTIDIIIGKAMLKIKRDDTENLKLVLKTLLDVC